MWFCVSARPRVGRLERLDGRDVATLVYRYRRHTVDVFVRPHGSRAWSVAPHAVRGFNVAGEQGPTMDWLAVSDAEPDALLALVRRLAREDAAR